MGERYYFDKLTFNNHVFLRPHCPYAFITPGVTVRGRLPKQIMAAYAAGPQYKINEETYRGHWLN